MDMLLRLTLLAIVAIAVRSSSPLPPVSNATLIAHPPSGIFIQYIGEYMPSDFITNISIIIPLTNTYCNIIPLIMARNIPQCADRFDLTHHRRSGRQIGEGWIAMGIAGTAVALATANRVKMSSLETKLNNFAAQMAHSQHTVNVNTARIGHLHDGLMKIGNELRNTQQLLFEQEQMDHQRNHSISIINGSLNILANHVNNLEHKIRNIFISQAINDIYRGQTSLSMIDPDDMPVLINQLLNVIDENSQKFFQHMPINQIIYNLLIAQHLTFILPTVYDTENPNEIGRLIFTNFFGVPRSNISYSIYEVKSVPYFVHDFFVRVIDLPLYIGQCVVDGTFLEFYTEDIKLCSFGNWTICKDQPPILTTFANPCLREILTKDTTDTCTTAKLPDAKFFVHQLVDSYWLVSLNQSQDCIKMPLQLDADTASRSKLIVNNIRVKLPPVALVSVLPMTTIICEGFSLVGRRFSSTNKNIILITNSTMHRADIDTFNIPMDLHKNWNIKRFNTKSIDDILSFIEKTPAPPPQTPLYFSFTNSIWQTITLLLFVVLSIIIIIIILVCYCNRSKACSCLLHRNGNDRNEELELQHFDRYSADELKRYYDRIKLPKY